MCLRRYLKINSEAILRTKKEGKCVDNKVVAYGAGRRKDSVN